MNDELQTMRLTAAITQEGDWFVARCLEVEVTSQGCATDEAEANLKEALELFLEDREDQPVTEVHRPLIRTLEIAR